MSTPVKKKTTSSTTSKTTTTRVSKTNPSTKIEEASSTFKGDSDLYIAFGAPAKKSSLQFKKQISKIYGVEEYIWTGSLKNGKIEFFRPNLSKVPTCDIYNSGYTLVGNALKAFEIKNALIDRSHCTEDGQSYNYCNPESVLNYIGDDKIHTVYVRIYDNTSGDNNDRWVTLSIE